MKFKQRGYPTSTEKETVSASDEDAIADLLEKHDQFVSSMQSRSAKLQVIFINFEMLKILCSAIFFMHRVYLYTTMSLSAAMFVDLGSQLCLDELLVPFLFDFIFDLVTSSYFLYEKKKPTRSSFDIELYFNFFLLFVIGFLERFSVGVIVATKMQALLNCAIQDDSGRNYRSGFLC